MPPLIPQLAALAETVQDLGATVRPELAPTLLGAPRGPSPFLSRAPQLPPAHVRLPDAEGFPHLDIEVTSVLSEGGMGRIYLAEQRTLAREVAVKAVKTPGDPAQTDALLWEGAITGHLDHPGVTPVHLLGAGPDGSPLLVMKRIVGLPWTDLLALPDPSARVATLPKDRLRAHIEILMEVARTLHHAHQRGVVHLDLKPDNVMIGELGEVYLVDWGIATTLERAAAGGAGFFGTPVYVAPEVVRGGSIGPWTDVYLLGATLHTVLTGRPRHEGAGLSNVLERALASEPFVHDASVPDELGALANEATHSDPEKRPRDALAFRAALAEYLEHAASLTLSADGTARLAELRAAAERPASASSGPGGEGPPLADENAKSTRSIRLLTEARFAFRAALERWAENPQARRGLEKTHEATAELEIERENLAGAREAAAELPAIPEGLAGRLAALEERLRLRVASEAEPRRVEREQDLGAGAKARYVVILIICVIVVVTTVAQGGLEPVDLTFFENITPAQFLAIPVMFMVLITVGVLTLGRRLLLNAIGRRLVAMFFVATVGIAAHRAVLLISRSRVIHGVVGDMFLVSAVMAGIAIFVTPRAWVPVALTLAGGCAVAVWPSYATLAFNGFQLLTVASLAWALRGPRTAPAARAGAAG